MLGNFVAAKLKSEELALSDDEARAIASAGANVASKYSVKVDEKTAAWLALATTLGTVYGTKFVAMQFARQMVRAPASKG